MFYKSNQISPNRNSSPVVVHKQSNPSVNINVHQQHLTQTYYTPSKIISNQEQKFETIKSGNTMLTYQNQSPEKTKNNQNLDIQILKNDLVFRDQKIASLNKALELANQDRVRLRAVLEQKSAQCVNKEREIAKLLATIHQMEFRRSENLIIKELQQQIEILKDFIKTNALHKQKDKNGETQNQDQLNQLQEQLQQSIQQNESLQLYVTDLMKQNKEISQKYAEKCIELYKLEMQDGQLEIMQKQLKGKEEEIEILKKELNKDQTNIEQQNEIQKFLSTIKKQFLEESPKGDQDDSINVYRPMYSFQSTEEISKVEFQKPNK